MALVNAENREINEIGALGLSGSANYGDSGGPLFLERDGRWIVVGVINSIIDEKDEMFPFMICTRVSFNLKWIRNIMYGNILDDSYRNRD
ncbi:hypothetical protein B4U79_18462 [Dinothrombium tinctorium]|uniref:Peptidase S1 domain-containing protein n=1 Tax=Dinothrombium tinctorium TaxID=1965070 RepID=A0A443QIN5_9ACAR|nr:hypothetical protein B4U79_18462 [Dinothrombium tinctorium]